MAVRLLTLLAGAALLPAAAAAAETTVAAVDGPTPIREHTGVAVLSVFDREAGVFRLAVSRDGAPPEPLPVPPRTVAFDADIGPEVDGGLTVVYSRCATEAAGARRPRGCDLFQLALQDPTEQRIAAVSTAGASEQRPTLYRGRVAFARTPDTGRARTRVVSHRLRGPGSRGVLRIAVRGRVDELELRGRHLALAQTTSARHVGVCGRSAIRLHRLGGRMRTLARQVCGLSGQSYAGLSFDARHLYWARFCAGDPGGCSTRNAGAFRYELRRRRFALAGFVGRLTGFAYAQHRRTLQVRGDAECGSAPIDEFPPCRVVVSDPLTFRRTKAPR